MKHIRNLSQTNRLMTGSTDKQFAFNRQKIGKCLETKAFSEKWKVIFPHLRSRIMRKPRVYTTLNDTSSDNMQIYSMWSQKDQQVLSDFILLCGLWCKCAESWPQTNMQAKNTAGEKELLYIHKQKIEINSKNRHTSRTLVDLCDTRKCKYRKKQLFQDCKWLCVRVCLWHG